MKTLSKTILLSFLSFFCLAQVSIAEECKDDPDQCTPKKLCNISTEMVNGLKFWTSNLDFDEHVKFAKEIGIDCGASDPKSPCDLDANECKISELCEKATVTKGSDISWNFKAEKHVALAKEYGLSCNVQEASPLVSTRSTRFSNWSDETICWYVQQKNKSVYIQEASNRGLDCGVKKISSVSSRSNRFANWSDETICWYVQEKNETAYLDEASNRGLDCMALNSTKKSSVKICNLQNLQLCNTQRLCEIATVKLQYSRGIKWKSSSGFQPAVREAKKRGLACGVETASIFAGQNIASSFKSQSQVRRKQIQYALNKLGYYRMNIDGLWGNGTKNALTSFATDESWLEKSPSFLFSQILNRVSVPSTFSSVKKPRSTSSTSSSNTRGWVPLSGNPKLPFDDAKDICEAKAEAEGRSYLNANKPSRRSNSVNCYAYGSRSFSCSQGSSGGMWAGIAEGLAKSQARGAAKDLAQAVAKACMADYGWIKR